MISPALKIDSVLSLYQNKQSIILRLQLSILLVFLTLTSLNSQVVKYSNEFLSIGVGARPLSMAGSVVASLEDVTSGYWNPAGLTGQDHTSQVCLMHNEYFAGMANYDYGLFRCALMKRVLQVFRLSGLEWMISLILLI